MLVGISGYVRVGQELKHCAGPVKACKNSPELQLSQELDPGEEQLLQGISQSVHSFNPEF